MTIDPKICIVGVVLALSGRAHALSAQNGNSGDQLVIRDAVLPYAGDWEGRWNAPYVLSDPESKYSTALLSPKLVRDSSTGESYGPMSLLHQSSRKVSQGLTTERLRVYGSSVIDTTSCLIRTPNGIEFVAIDWSAEPDLSAWSLSAKQFSRWIAHPDPPAGMPALLGFKFLESAGDLNTDGYDEIFFQDSTANGRGVAGCLDGASGDLLWVDYVDNYNLTSRVQLPSPTTSLDLDGDGVNDFVAGFEIVRFNDHQHLLKAYSGLTGQVIWEKEFSRYKFYLRRKTVRTRDIDGDGVSDLISLDAPDVAVGKYGNLRAISGSDGKRIWSVDCSFVHTLLPNATWFGMGSPICVNPRPDGSGLDLWIYCRWSEVPGDDTASILILDLSSGASLRTVSFPVTNEPWHTDPFSVGPRVWFAGDYDGDGFQELSRQQFIDEDVSANFFPAAAVVIGQRTLYGPDAPQLGATEDFRIGLPALPGSTANLVFSTGFAPRGDDLTYAPEGWVSSLRIGNLVNQTANNPQLRATLDAAGQATIPVTFPQSASLAGTQLYVRGFIEDPAQPGEIRTQTSLHWLTLQP